MRSPRDVRLEELFQIACELPPDERPAFYQRHCADDPELRAELEELLAQDEEGTRDYLTSPVLEGQPMVAAPRALSHDPARPVTRVGPYRVLRKLGEGGMGVVYLAEQDEPLRRRVALKIVKPGMDTPRVLLRFESERRVLARMEHEGIAHLYDAGALENGRPFFVMEFVDGRPITTFCDELRLSVPGRLALFLKVCDAVQHAHQRGIIHRDLTPRNVLVALEGDRAVPKVIDFGVAQSLANARIDGVPHAGTADVVGTRRSMSPEQADPTGDGVDTRTDVYALGALLYELLAGVSPFEEQDFAERELLEVLRAGVGAAPSARLVEPAVDAATIASRRATTPRALRRRLRGDLDAIVACAMAPDQARRYGTVTELAADVRRHRSHDELVARHLGVLERGWRAVRRHPIRAALTAVLATAASVGVVAARLEAESAQQDRQRALEVTRFLADSLTTDPFRITPGLRSERLSTLEQIHAYLEDGALAGQPLAEIRVRQALGKAYHALGELGLAAVELRQALELVVEQDGIPPEVRLPVEAELAHVDLDADQRDASDLLYVSEISLIRTVSERQPPLGRRLDGVVQVVTRRAWDQLPRMLAELEGAANRAMEPADPTWLLLADLLTAESVWAEWLGRAEGAVPLARAALSIRREKLPATHPDLAQSIEQVARLLLSVDHAATAGALLVEALNIRQDTLGPQHWLVARVRSLLGECQTTLGRRAEAEGLLRSGLEELRAQLGPFNFETGQATWRLLRFLEGEGDPRAVAAARDELARAFAFAPNRMRYWGRQRDAFGAELAPLVEAADGVEALLRDETGIRGADQRAQLVTALDRLEAAWSLLGEQDEPRRIVLAHCLHNWTGRVPLYWDFERERLLRWAASVLERHADTLAFDLAEALDRLGDVAFFQGDLDAAARLGRRAAELFERSDVPFSFSEQATQRRLAECEARTGDVEAGLLRAQRSLEQSRAWCGFDDSVVSDAAATLVGILLDARRGADAAARLEPLLRAGLESGAPNRVQAELAWIMVRRAGLPEALSVLAGRVAALRSEVDKEDPLASLTLAAAALRQGRAGAALSMLDAALAGQRRSRELLASNDALRALAAAALGDTTRRDQALGDLQHTMEEVGIDLRLEGPLIDEASGLDG